MRQEMRRCDLALFDRKVGRVLLSRFSRNENSSWRHRVPLNTLVTHVVLCDTVYCLSYKITLRRAIWLS